MWETQPEKFTTSKKVNLDFVLPEFSATNIVTCKYYVYELINSRYDKILGKDILTALGLDLKFAEKVVSSSKILHEG